MKWKNHKIIADKISNSLGFSSEDKKEFREASVLPDKWENYPHHKRKDGDIREKIKEAREKRIQKEKLR